MPYCYRLQMVKEYLKRSVLYIKLSQPQHGPFFLPAMATIVYNKRSDMRTLQTTDGRGVPDEERDVHEAVSAGEQSLPAARHGNHGNLLQDPGETERRGGLPQESRQTFR